MRILSENPEIIAKNPAMLNDLMEKIRPDMSARAISFVSVEPSRREDLGSSRQMREQIDEICRRVKTEVLEEIHSKIPGLLDATKMTTSIRNTVQASNESVRMLSEIEEVKEIYAYIEPDNLRLVVIHGETDRIEILRKVVEIETLFDLKFEDIYFEFKVLHHSEVNESSISDGLLIFRRA